MTSGGPLCAAFSVIPGQDQRNEKPDTQRDDDEAHRLFGPAESLRDNVDALEQRERRRDIGQRPLHKLSLLQALQEFIHAQTTVALQTLRRFSSAKKFFISKRSFL